MAELTDEEKRLLRQVFLTARMARLRPVFRLGSGSTDEEVAAAMDDAKAMIKLEQKILHPPIEVDWANTRLGRRLARRNRHRI